MRLVLVALNARFSHTNLAVRCLRAAVRRRVSASECDVVCREYTIHDDVGGIVGDIYALRPDAVGFSCYIWNRAQMLAVIRRLRLVCPQASLLCGGPEVSGDAEEFLREHPEVDWVVTGEGEGVLAEFVAGYLRDEIPCLPGLIGRGTAEKTEGAAGAAGVGEAGGHAAGGSVKAAGYGLMGENVPGDSEESWWVDPYTEEEDFSGRYVYLEASRGCPFRCAYCLSARDNGVRYMDSDKLAGVLGRLFQWGARTVKMVDRTFNAHPRGRRVLDVFRDAWQGFVLENPECEKDTVRIHCEFSGDLLDERWMDYLAAFPVGMIQLEMGVQSVHQETLARMNRRQVFENWAGKAAALQHRHGIPVHLDLIAGLPGEEMAAVLVSLDRVMQVRPHHVQLGFLKLLKGSPLCEQADRYGIVACPDAPYEVLRTEAMSYDEILLLRSVAYVLDKYYNAGFVRYGWEAMVREFASFSDMVRRLAEFWRGRGWLGRLWKRQDLLHNLYLFLQAAVSGAEARERCREALRFDYYAAGGLARQVPDWLMGPAERDADAAKYPQLDKENWRRCLPEALMVEKRVWGRRTAVSCFRYDVPRQIPLHPAGGCNQVSPLGQGQDKDRRRYQEGWVWYLFWTKADGEVVFFHLPECFMKKD